MGGGTGELVTPTGDLAKWMYPPNSSSEENLKLACSW
jgi:hypothetical protein